jgi:hypothetical protein
MADIASAIRKVQQHYGTRTVATRPSTRVFLERTSRENDRSDQPAESRKHRTSQL